MGRLVHNDELNYDVDVTASLWWNALQDWKGRTEAGEDVDIIIGVDGRPLIIPDGVALYSGEWYVSVDRVADGIRMMNEKYGVTLKPFGVSSRYMTNGHLERYMHDMTVMGDGVVQRYRTQNMDGSRGLAYVDTNNQPVHIYTRTPRKYNSDRRACECIYSRFKYDIAHNTRYIIDNFGDPANKQEMKTAVECNHNKGINDKEVHEMTTEIDKQIRAMEKLLRVDYFSAMPKWLHVMGEWAESNEYGHRMHVVVDEHGEPYCTDAPWDNEICWETLVAANMDWRDVLDGYQDDPYSKWYVLDDDGVQCNMWGLANAVEMRNALCKAIADYYANW